MKRLKSAKIEELKRFVAEVNPGFMYIHDIDAGGWLPCRGDLETALRRNAASAGQATNYPARTARPELMPPGSDRCAGN